MEDSGHMENMSDQLLQPQVSLGGRLATYHLKVTSCFQCKKCSGGCPLTFAMDLFPDQVIRLALLGQEEEVLGSRTIWVCSSCETCTSRCPNGIDIAGVMDWLKQEAVKQGKAIPEKDVVQFHRFFLESIRAEGRLSETKLLRRYNYYKFRRQANLAEIKQNMRLGWKLWKRRRVRLTGPPALRGKAEIQKLFQKANL
jgi:heterodisulfide reductase subunit C